MKRALSAATQEGKGDSSLAFPRRSSAPCRAPLGRPPPGSGSRSDPYTGRTHGGRRTPTAAGRASAAAPDTAGAPAEPGWCRGAAGVGPKGQRREDAALQGLTRGSRELAKLPAATEPPCIRAERRLPAPRSLQRSLPPPPEADGDSPACNQAATEERPRRLPPGPRLRTTAPGCPRAGAARRGNEPHNAPGRRCWRPPPSCGSAGSGAGFRAGGAARLGGGAGPWP